MTDEQPGQPAPDQVDGINVPAAVEKLLADMETLKARVATLETKVP